MELPSPPDRHSMVKQTEKTTPWEGAFNYCIIWTSWSWRCRVSEIIVAAAAAFCVIYFWDILLATHNSGWIAASSLVFS